MKLTNIIAAATLSLTAVTASYAADAPATGIIGLKIVVADYDKAMAFYSKLGLKPGVKYNPAEQEMLSESPQAVIRLILVHDTTGRVKRPAGASEMMLVVPDIQATVKALKDAGYPNIGEPRLLMGQSWQLMIKDPDGDDIELLSPVAKK